VLDLPLAIIDRLIGIDSGIGDDVPHSSA
jgi:hypothetical protein